MARGQAAIEYVTAVGVVCAVLVLGGAAIGAPSVANAVGRGMRHALCVVSGGSGCAAVDPSPCVLRATTLKGAVSAKVAIVKVGRDAAILRADRSDGTVDITLLDHGAAGLEVGLGAQASVELGHLAVSAGGLAQAALIATLGGGRTWRVRGTRAADRLVRRLEIVLAGRAASSVPIAGRALDLGQRLLGKGAHDHLPTPDARTYDAALHGEVEGALGALGDLRGGATVLIGRRRARGGATTWLLRVGGEAGLALAHAAGVSGGGDVGLSLTRDARGRWVSLGLTATGRLAGGAVVPIGALSRRGEQGGEVEVAATLDLTDAENRGAAAAVVRALSRGHAVALGQAAVALARIVDRSGALEVTAYRSAREALGAKAEVAVGLKLGIGAELSRLQRVLEGAWSRPPGGAWERRLDCVA